MCKKSNFHQDNTHTPGNHFQLASIASLKLFVFLLADEFETDTELYFSCDINLLRQNVDQGFLMSQGQNTHCSVVPITCNLICNVH